MKKTFLIILLLFATTIFAQQDTSSILVKKSDLTQEQIQKIETNKTVQTVSQWVGLGKEVGVAMNEGLVALTQNAVNFSETGLGKYTMFLIGWKVLGKDVTQLLLKVFIVIPVWVILISVLIWTYRRSTLPKRYLSKKTIVGKRFWLFDKYDKEWMISDPDLEIEQRGFYNVAYVIVFCALTFILTAIIL